MSRYTYAGDFVNPTSSWRVAQVFDANGEYLHSIIECHHSEEREIDGQTGTFSYWAPHTSGQQFEDDDQAHEWIENTEEMFERDYDDYLEENRDAIVQMERYEMWRNEQ